MPVNPLSVILITLRPLNETSTLANFQSYLGVADALTSVDLAFRGQSLINMTGRDAAMMALFRHGIHIWQTNADDTDNDRRAVVIPLVLGRRPYDPNSAFPQTRRGELTLSLDVDIADTGYDGLQYTVETVELLDASPTEYEKQVQLTHTWTATGLNDLDLPLGNAYRGLLLFGTTSFAGAAPAPSWGRISLLAANREFGYSSTDFEVAATLAGLMSAKHPIYDEHIHRVDASSASATEPTDTPAGVSAPFESYAFLPLDPLNDDTYTMETAGLSRFHLRADAETADAIRVIPVERVRI
jgi:hypothetical protein